MSFSKIAIWNPAFLGDALLTLPLIHSLRRAYPLAEIDFYVRQGFQELFTSDPALTRVFAWSKGEYKPQQFWQARQTLVARNYDLWISGHESWYSAFIARLSGAKERIGYRDFLRSWFYSKTIPRQFQVLHERDRLLELVRPLGVSEVVLWPKLNFDQTATAKAQEFYSQNPGPWLGIHPGSVWPTKRWVPEYFAQVAKLAAAQGIKVMFFGGPGEERMAEEVMSQANLGSQAHSVIGQLSLSELAAYIKGLSCYLGNDSGPMHLAWLQEVPVTAIFGPTVTKFGFTPLQKTPDYRSQVQKVMEIPLPCRPCGLHGTKTCKLKHHHCMTKISVDMVWTDVQAKLGLSTKHL